MTSPAPVDTIVSTQRLAANQPAYRSLALINQRLYVVTVRLSSGGLSLGNEENLTEGARKTIADHLTQLFDQYYSLNRPLENASITQEVSLSTFETTQAVQTNNLNYKPGIEQRDAQGQIALITRCIYNKIIASQFPRPPLPRRPSTPPSRLRHVPGQHSGPRQHSSLRPMPLRARRCADFNIGRPSQAAAAAAGAGRSPSLSGQSGGAFRIPPGRTLSPIELRLLPDTSRLAADATRPPSEGRGVGTGQ